MYEHISEPLLPRDAFIRRVVSQAGGAVLLLGGSLGIGILGYRFLADLSWIDAFLNASMILSGMGPVDLLTNDTAKLFAGIYALYSGVVFLVAVGLVFAPLLHRLLHSLHLQAKRPADADTDGGAGGAGSTGTTSGGATGSSAT